MRAVFAAVALLLAVPAVVAAAAQAPDAERMAAYLRTLPAVAAPVFDETRREALAAAAISCEDRPEEAPANRNNYLWQYDKGPQLLDAYDRNRAFFGCANWHDAAAQVWMLETVLRQDPKIPLASSIKDILTTHFRKGNVDGEMAWFTNPPATDPIYGPLNFEQPYGYAWLLKIYGEGKGYGNADGKKLAAAVTPLAKWMSEKLVYYLYNLKYPYRTGVENNTAFTMWLVYDSAALSDDATLKTAVAANAQRLFGGDKDCPTGLEPQNSDLISSCLSEAALMGRTMEQGAFVSWLNAFLPAADSEAFQVYARDVDISHMSVAGPDAQVQQAAASRKVGLNFERAASLLTIANALPASDARVAVYRRLAAMSAVHGYEKFNATGYEGSHWLPAFAMLYENAAKGPALNGPEKSVAGN